MDVMIHWKFTTLWLVLTALFFFFFLSLFREKWLLCRLTHQEEGVPHWKQEVEEEAVSTLLLLKGSTLPAAVCPLTPKHPTAPTLLLPVCPYL